MPAQDEIGPTPQLSGPVVSDSMGTGYVLDDRFEILERIGAGGMSTVYRARHLQLQKDVAVKVLKPSLMVDAGAAKRFRREAMAVQSLNHPNIIKVYSFGALASGALFMVMEFLQGRNLADVIREEGRLSRERALPIFCQILDALDHAHSNGIIHRDLKPSNVVLSGADQSVKVIDFGIASILPESGTQMQKLTQTGALLGSVNYMSPEQCSAKPVDARSDLYSFGCLMYETLDGQPPFVGTSPYAVISKQLEVRPHASKFIDARLGQVISHTLEKEPKSRPTSAKLLKEALLEPTSYVSPQAGARKKRFAVGAIGGALICISVWQGYEMLVHTNQAKWQREDAAAAYDQLMRRGYKGVEAAQTHQWKLGPLHMAEADRDFENASNDFFKAAEQAKLANLPSKVLHAKIQALDALSLRMVPSNPELMTARNLLEQLIPQFGSEADLQRQAYNFDYAHSLELLDGVNEMLPSANRTEIAKRWLSYEECMASNKDCKYPYSGSDVQSQSRRLLKAHKAMAIAYLSSKNYDQAITQADLARKIPLGGISRREDSEDLFAALQAKAIASLAIKDYRSAEQGLLQALKLHQMIRASNRLEEASLEAHLAESYVGEGKHSKAIATYDRAVSLNPNLADRHLELYRHNGRAGNNAREKSGAAGKE
jgi:tRNA A-37 threonylcarbamoyl transferase component Bud32/tetratricopeptide (TPR) repeat protein